MRRSRKVFLDTSVVIAAVLSPTGGARQLFRLSVAGVITLVVGPNVLRECEEVVRRKIPASLPTLARLLDTSLVITCALPTGKQLDMAGRWVQYPPDAHALAEAIQSGPDWFVTYDKEHFLKSHHNELPFQVGTPGDLIQVIKNELHE